MFCSRIHNKLDRILNRLSRLENGQAHILRKERKIMATIDDVLAGVAELDTQEDSLIALTANIKAALDTALANQGIPADVQEKIDAVFAGIEANKAQVVEAINTNTPAA